MRMIHTTSDSTGRPRTKVRPSAIALSWMNSARVDLLKPCFSSTTNVPYKEKGRVTTVSKIVSNTINSHVMTIS